MFKFRNHNTILVLDDQVGPRQAIKTILEGKYNVLTSDNPQETIDAISAGGVDILMLDIRMPGVDGLKLLKAIKAIDADVEVVIITGYPSTESAIEAMQYGAYDYVIKPFDKERIEQVVREGIVRRTKGKLQKSLKYNFISELFEKFTHKAHPNHS